MKTTVLIPIEDRVLIDPDPAPTELGGLKIADTHKKAHQPPKGTVIAVGPGKADKLFLKRVGSQDLDGELTPVVSDGGEPIYTTTTMPLKPGDRVMYGAYANMEVEDPKSKEKFLCLRLADCFILLDE
jgi:co-chaperonin GroES (HSP10)